MKVAETPSFGWGSPLILTLGLSFVHFEVSGTQGRVRDRLENLSFEFRTPFNVAKQNECRHNTIIGYILSGPEELV